MESTIEVTMCLLSPIKEVFNLYGINFRKIIGCLLGVYSISVTWRMSLLFSWKCTLCHWLSEGQLFSPMDYSISVTSRRSAVVSWMCTLYQLLEKAGSCFLKMYSISVTWGSTVLFLESVLYINYLRTNDVVSWRCTLYLLLGEAWCSFLEGVLYISYLRKHDVVSWRGILY
jgi:hypothetical protein